MLAAGRGARLLAPLLITIAQAAPGTVAGRFVACPAEESCSLGQAGFYVEVFNFTQGVALPRDLAHRRPSRQFVTPQVCFATSTASSAETNCPTDVQLCSSHNTSVNCTLASFCETVIGIAACEHLAFRFAANLAITSGGIYRFRLISDDGSRLKLVNLAANAPPIVDNDGIHSVQEERESNTFLPAGTHALELEYFMVSGKAGLRLDYRGPDTAHDWALIGDAATVRAPDQVPVIFVSGQDPAYVLLGSTWHEPGVTCMDREDGLLPTDYLHPSTASIGNFTIQYTCTDSLQHMVSTQRTVVVRGMPRIVLRGSRLQRIGLGQEFVDPGACCFDFENVSMTVSSFGLIDNTTAGKYSRAYQCADSYTGTLVVSTRIVTVDQPPTLSLVGSPTQKVTKGLRYRDDGVLCQDIEDGRITWHLPSMTATLDIARMTTHTGRSPTHTCDGCVRTDAGDPPLLRLDLGDIRVVHQLWLRSIEPGLLVRVGSSLDLNHSDPLCRMAKSVSSGAITCRSPLAGRFVTLTNTRVGGGPLVLCQLEVVGSRGPGLPNAFSVNGSQCPALQGLEGTYEVVGEANGYPEYGGPTGGRLWRASGDFEAGWWSFSGSSEEVARLLSSGPLVPASWQVNESWPAECRPRLIFKPGDACTWLFGTSGVDGQYECADGHTCPCAEASNASCEDECCGPHGGLARCPPDKPQLCEQRFGGRFGCAVNCSARAGIRKCRTDTSQDALLEVEVTGYVNTSRPGNHSLVFTCVDSLGQRVSLSRTVEVGCEGPNPGGIHGGNSLQCDDNFVADDTLTSAKLCADECLGHAYCEAFEYEEEGSCQLWRVCDGIYHRDERTTVYVGYCNRIDHPPRVVLQEGSCCVNVGDNYVDAGCTCEDLEDSQPPVPTAANNLDTSTPGNYLFEYACTDTAGQTSHGNRTVTVKADCAVPRGVANVFAEGPCRGVSSNVVPHGGRCILQCAEGWAPSRFQLTCQTLDDMDYASQWDSPFVCGPMPCDAPNVASVKDGSSGPQSCREGYQVPSSYVCTPNCLGDGWPSYVPTESSLSCWQGSLSPRTFKCRLPAGQPDYIFLGTPAVLEVEVGWAAGASNDCGFLQWEVQARRLSPVTQNWQNVSGCQSAAVKQQGRTAREKTRCQASGLAEGATYEFRVREVCTVTAMTSPWRSSTSVTMKTVPPPQLVFLAPSSDVRFNPGRIMIAFSTDCTTSGYDSVWANVSQSGEFCSGRSFGRRASDVRASSISGPGIELAGRRIILISTPPDFFEKGCTISVRLGEGLIQTSMLPAKPSPGLSWNFTYIDRRPELAMFAALSASAEGGSFRVQWDEPTSFDCTARPSNQTTCEQKAVWEVDSETAVQLCKPGHSAAELQQPLVSAHVDFEIRGLYPGVDYTLNCSGHELGKWWVPTMPTPTVQSGPMGFRTEEAASTEVSTLDLEVWAVCPDGRTELRRTESVRQVDLVLGFTAQVLDYKIFCIGGNQLQPGEQATLRIQATTRAVSVSSRLTWLSGPSLDLVYTRPSVGVAEVASTLLLFKICPLSHARNPYEYPCQFYELNLRAVDVSFTFDSASFRVRKTGPDDASVPNPHNGRALMDIGAGGQDMLEIGTVGLLPASASEGSFDWSEVGMLLGSPEEGFQLPTNYSGSELQFQLIGQGTSLPLMLSWRTALFKMNILISFAPPRITLQPLRASILSPTLLRVHLSHVPNRTALPLLDPSIPAAAGYASPSRFLQLLAIKDGQPSDENLCKGGTQFGQGGDWHIATCMLAPAALENITLALRVLDMAVRVLRTANGTHVRGAVSYAPPVFLGLADPEAGVGSAAGKVALGLIANRSGPALAVLGRQLPQVAGLELDGGRFVGYHLQLQGHAASFVDLCASVSSESTERLRCEINRCLHILALPQRPRLRMYLGDLVAAETLEDQLELPLPQILEFGPTTVDDAGPNRTLWFRGRHFGELECKPEHPDGVQLVGARTGVRIRVGPLDVPCHVLFQNSTNIECEIRDPLMEAVTASYVGEELPPIQRTSLQQVQFSVSGHLPALNTDPQAGMLAGLPLLQVEVVLTGCPDGMRRIKEGSSACIHCPRGRWVTRDSTSWPLQCEVCPSGRYQDLEGATRCKACPPNTVTLGGAIALSDCLCKPGYYSQYLNETTGASVPGATCVGCHDVDMTDLPAPGERCGDTIPVSEVCDVRSSDACVGRGAGLRVCKAYCPGGTSWPQAKRTFWHAENARTGGPGELGLYRFEPAIIRCIPTAACLGQNLCGKMYHGVGCNQCVFGYWQDLTTKVCKPCGPDQTFGEIVMVVVIIMAVFGGLSGYIFYMRLGADIQFKQEVLKIMEASIIQPLRSSACFNRLLGQKELRKVVVLYTNDVGRNLCYAKKQDLGMVLRVDEWRIVHVAGLSLGSPVRGKVGVGWKLQTVNGQRLTVRSEDEILTILKEATLPIRLTFSAPSKPATQQSGVARSSAGVEPDLADDRKMLIILFAIMRSFEQISMFEFNWPPVFRRLAMIASQISFNFSFFHPECTVDVHVVTRWLYVLSVPYAMMIPLIMALAIASALTLSNQSGPAFSTKRTLLANAFVRCCCMTFTLFIPSQLDQLLVPLECTQGSKGAWVVSAMPKTPCTLDNPMYRFIFQVSCVGTFLMLFFLSALFVCLHKSFKWQSGKSRVRDHIPFYVAAVEMTTFGQRGYIPEVRDRVFENICAARSFQPDSEKLARRELIAEAVDQLGHRVRWVPECSSSPGAGCAEVHTGAPESVAEDFGSLQAKRRLRQRRRWPEKPDGNVVTYGWVLIVNFFLRQLFSLIIVKLTQGRLVVVGAAFQMILIGVNITLLISFQPYKSGAVTRTEGMLLMVLFSLLWCAVLKDLIENHNDAAKFMDTVSRVNSVIEVLAVALLVVLLLVPLYQVGLAVKHLLDVFLSPDDMLNELYMTQHLRKEKETSEADMNRLRDFIKSEKDEDMVQVLAAKLPVLDKAMACINEAGMDKHVDASEQQRLLIRLAKLVKKMDEGKQQRHELQLAMDSPG